MSYTGTGPDHAREALIRANERLLESGQGADMTIINLQGSKAYHSAIVCPRSRVLSAAYWGSFKEGVTKTIDLSASNQPFAIEYMMRYFYVLDYPTFERPDMQLYVHAHMYSTADKYDVPDLRQIALQTFTHWCEKLSSRPQAEEAAEYLDLFLYAVYTVYECLPELDGSLRKPLTKALARFLNASPALINLEEYRDRCLEYPLFGLDMQKESLLLTHAGEPGWEIEEE